MECGIDRERAQARHMLRTARVARDAVEAGELTIDFEDEEITAVEQALEDRAKVVARHRVVAQVGHDPLVHVEIEDGVEVRGGGEAVQGHVALLL
ncbi:hypothetical protein D3C72_1652420 [compost metagenome]